MTPAERLEELGIELPSAPAAAAAYLPWARSGDLVFVSGQIPVRDGTPAWTGRVGDDVDIDTAAEAARLCAVNVIAQLAAAAGGDLGRVARIVKISVFVASAPNFTDQHLVANGASQLFADVFGEAGTHARAAVGTAALPLGVPVEVEAVARLSP